LVKLLDTIATTLHKEARGQATEAKGWRRKLEGRSTKMVGGVRLNGMMVLDGGVIDRESFLKRQSRGVYPAGQSYDEFAAKMGGEEKRIAGAVAKNKEENIKRTEYLKEHPEEQDVRCTVREDLELGRDTVPMGVCGDRHQRRNQKLTDANPFGKILKGLTTVGDVLTSIVPMPGIVKQGWKIGKELSGQKSYLDGNGKTHRENVLKKYDMEDRPHSMKELSKISKVPLKIIMEVYKRGIGAYKTQPKSVRLKGSFVKNVDAPMSAKLSKEAWAAARVYSFLDGNPKHDEDLRTNKGGAVSIPPRLRTLIAGGDHNDCMCGGGGDCGCGCGGVLDRFKEQLEKAGLSPKRYLDTARAAAKRAGYDPKSVEFSDTNKHKLMICTPEGKVKRFGAVGNGDFIIWSAVDKAKAAVKRNTFHKSHGAMKGNWRADKYSPNNLALGILW
jgi:hypothetical protein